MRYLNTFMWQIGVNNFFSLLLHFFVSTSLHFFLLANSIHPAFVPLSLHPSRPTSTLSFAWEDRLMWAILPNRRYMSATWWNWFSTPIAFPFLHSLPLPYGSHSFFMLPPSLWEISSRKKERGEIAWATLWHVCLCVCMHIYAMCKCVCVCAGLVRVVWLSAGLTGEG